jgi:tetratricopeptide (TPR) repeat protein
VVFGIDPETYIQKAQTYLEQQEYEKSYKYFIKAKEWYQEKGDSENVNLCEDYITAVEKEIEEYSLLSDVVESAQNYFDTGNEFLLWKKYDDALESFTLSLQLYEKIGNEKGVDKCNQRIEYIREKIKENEKFNFNMDILLFIIFALLCIAFLKRRNT